MFSVLIVTKNYQKDLGGGITPEDLLPGYDVTITKPIFTNEYLVKTNPKVILTFGEIDDFNELSNQSIDIRSKWLHNPHLLAFDDNVVEYINHIVNNVFLENIINSKPMAGRFPSFPMISVITPLYQTGDVIIDVYRSLRAQTYDNWEWILYADGETDGALDRMQEFAKFDHRIKIFKAKHSGVIGDVKNRAFGLARGSILAELDHDDILTSNCLEYLRQASIKFPDAGFFYTDCAEIDSTSGVSLTYGEGFAFGYGSYRDEEYFGRNFKVMNCPSINAKTIRHIVGVPNHLRAWRSDFYHSIGGHNVDLHVADDYELLLRTFLTTRMVHIKKFGYIQHLHQDGSNAHRRRNSDIQTIVGLLSRYYEGAIHKRFIELEVDDFIWTEQGPDFSIQNPEITEVANYEYSD